MIKTKRQRLPAENRQADEHSHAARAHKIIAECSHVLVRASEERQLLREMCRILVDSGGYLVAWVGLVRHDEDRTIEPVASAGDHDNYLGSIRLSWGDNAFGRGPAGMAIRTGKPQAVRDVLTNPNFAAWRDQALARGYQVLASLPLICEGETLGVFGIFAGESSALDTGELELLGELARDIAYGVYTLRAREAQRRAEADLRESELRFQATFDQAAVGIARVDPEGRITLANRRLHEILGFEPGTLPGRTYKELSHPDDANATDARRADLHSGKIENFGAEKRYLRKDGSTAWIRLTVSLMRGVGDLQQYEISVFEDITANKRAELLLKLEHTVTRSLAEADNASSAMKSVIRAVCETEGWECGRFLRADEKAGALHLDEVWGIQSPAIERFLEESRGVSYRRGVGLAGTVWETGQTLWIPDVEKDARAMRKTLIREIGLHGAIFFPIQSEGKTLGVLAFNSREIREPDERLMQAVRVIGAQIGQFMRRKVAEETLRESETHYRALSELSADWYWEQDAQFRFTEISGRLGEEKQFRREVWLGKARWELPYVDVSEDDWGAHQAALEAHRPFRDFVVASRRKNGSLQYISTGGYPVFDSAGSFVGYRGIARDVSERKRAEQLQKLEDTVALSLAEADSASEALKAAIRAVCETEGWECGRYFRPDEKAGVLRFGESWGVADPAIQQFIEHSHELVFKPGAGLVGKVWQSGEPLWVPDVTQDTRALRAGFMFELGIRGAFVFPIISEGKTIGVLGFNSREVREPDERLLQAIRVIGSQIGQFVRRKQAEETRRESETHYRALSELSADWYWEQDAQFRFTEISGHLGEEMQFPREIWLGKTRWELPYVRVNEEDWPAHQAALEAHRPFRDFVVASQRKDGSLQHVSNSGYPVFDSAGKFAGYRGIARDVSQTKRADQLLMLEHTVTRSLTEADSASSALKAAMRAVCEAGGWVIGRYFRVDEKAGLLRFVEAWSVSGETMDGFIAKSREVTYVPGIGFLGRVWQSGQPLWVADIDNDTRTHAGVARGIGMHGAFFFPVTSEGKTIGVLSFHAREVREPEERMLQAISAIGIQVGQVVRRKEAEAVLRAQALQQRLIAEFGQEALASTDLDGLLNRAVELASTTMQAEYSHVLQLNPDGQSLTYKAVTGWPKEWVGRRALQVRPDSHLEFVLSRRESIITEDYTAEKRSSPSRLLQYGVRSSMQVPIFGTMGVFGIFGMHTKKVRRFTADEVNFLQSVANILSVAIERKHAEERLSYLAQFDALTGLPNRHLFHDRLVHAVAQAKRSGHPMAVLFIDLDRFKLVNDTQGHRAGDKLLKETAARLARSVRASDTVARFGGDEFGAILSDLSRPGDASVVAEKVIEALAQPFDLDGHETFISASVGITLFPADGEDAGALIMNADVAMYRAKEQGRNNYQYFTREMNERALERVRLEAAMRRAIERREFLLHYQPKVDLRSGSVCGLEALLRWRHPERGLVSPAEFIPVLEDTGLIVAVGEWVMQAVCEQIGAWQKAGVAAPPVAINLSARQFQQKDLEATVRRILGSTGVGASLLEFELTESMLMKDPEAAEGVLQGLKEAGVKLSVDDFGTGYSSLAYLKRFPIDALKIDRAFIRDVTADADDAAITRAIISLAHSMNLKVVAEGVETKDQLDFLSAQHCDEMQGFYFARPLPVDECTRMLADDRRLETAG